MTSDGPKRALTVNQIVSMNLMRARRERGWTQEEAAARLEPYIGRRWSKATFSAVERSVTGKRIRQFTADDLVAFAAAFNLPVAYFLLPPGRDPDGSAVAVRTYGQEVEARLPVVGGVISGLISPEQLIALALSGGEEIARRLEEIVEFIPLTLRTAIQATAMLQTRVVVKEAMGDMEALEAHVRQFLDVLARIRSQVEDPSVARSDGDTA